MTNKKHEVVMFEIFLQLVLFITLAILLTFYTVLLLQAGEIKSLLFFGLLYYHISSIINFVFVHIEIPSTFILEGLIYQFIGILFLILITNVLRLRSPKRQPLDSPPPFPSQKVYFPFLLALISIILYLLDLYLSDSYYNVLVLGFAKDRVSEYWFLGSLATPIGMLAVSSLGFYFSDHGPSYRLGFIFILILLSFLSSGRMMIYCAIGSIVWKFIKTVGPRLTSIKAISFIYSFNIIAHFAGVFFRDLKGISPLLWPTYIGSGKYFQNLVWSGSESEIYSFYFYVIERGWDKIVDAPFTSLGRLLTVIFPRNLFPSIKFIDTSQALWIDAVSNNRFGLGGEDITQYPGSLPSTMIGEGLLNGGVIGLFLLLIIIALFLYTMERLSDYNYFIPYLAGIYFVSFSYIARGTFGWAVNSVAACITLILISKFIYNGFLKIRHGEYT